MTVEDHRARLRQARLDAGYSQRDLAALIGCADSTISAVELCHRDLGARLLIAWSHACGVSLDWIAAADIAARLESQQLVDLEPVHS